MIRAILALLMSVPAGAANLKLVSPAKSALKNPVQVKFAEQDGILYVHFAVKADELNAPEVFPKGKFPYDFDVVEVFVSVQGQARLPYFEFELSPHGQTFEVQINDPKKKFIEGVNMGIKTKATIVAGGWAGEFWIPLKNLGWDGDRTKIVGNAFAIQGFGKRSFWSLFLPPAPKARFHQPAYFKSLL